MVRSPGAGLWPAPGGQALSRLATAALAALLAATVLCPHALADGDPASDILIGASVFYPYSPPVSARLMKTLNAETAASAHAHFPIKVALIDSPADLGSIPSLFAKPQQYADFLDEEISLIGTPHPPLLVVMPNGYGAIGLPPAAAAAVASLARPAGTRSDDLADVAIRAVQQLAAAAGHRIEPITGPSDASHRGRSTAIIVILSLAAVAAAAIGTRRRLRASR